MSDDTATTDEAPEIEPSWFAIFRDKLFDGLKNRVSSDDYDAAMKSARSSVGGLAKAHKARSASDLPSCDRKRFAESESYPGLFVGLFLSPDAASQLAIEGGQPADILHITLAYFDDLEPDELTLARIVARIDDACSWRAPLTGNITGYTRFLATTGDTDVFAATPNVGGLAELAMSIDSAVESAFWPVAGPVGMPPNARAEYDFVPHISLAFIAPGSPNPVDTLPDVDLRFDRVTVVYGDRRIEIPFRGQSESVYGYEDVEVGDGTDGSPRLFMEQAFAEPPNRVAILPTPGSYAHASYGTVDITEERNARFVANHNNNVYGQKLPIQIDSGHDLKFSGAMGWLGSARVEADGSATAEVFWNPRGEQLIKEDRIKYLSPEWWDQWTDGATGEVYQDVLIGLALTNRPFFKNASLAPLAATEGDQTTGSDPQTKGPGMTQEAPVAMTEDQLKAFREQVKDELRGEVRQEFGERLTAAEEKANRLQEEATTKAFKEEIGGRGQGNEGGAPYVFSGELGDDYLAIMRELSPDTRKKFETISRRVAQSHSELMRIAGKEIGSDALGSDRTALDQLNVKAEEIKAATPTKTFAEAFTEACEANPKLYSEYRQMSTQGGR